MGAPQVDVQNPDGSRPSDLSANPGYVNPVKASDYQTVDFTQTGPGAAFGQQQATNLSQMQAALNAAYGGLQQNYTDTANQYSANAMQGAADQALRNVRGVGGTYGALGGANSGAAMAAAAEGARQPLYQAQQNIAQMQSGQAANLANLGQQNAFGVGQMGQQNINDLFSQFAGVVAPQYMQTPSELETQAGQTALSQANEQDRAS